MDMEWPTDNQAPPGPISSWRIIAIVGGAFLIIFGILVFAVLRKPPAPTPAPFTTKPEIALSPLPDPATTFEYERILNWIDSLPNDVKLFFLDAATVSATEFADTTINAESYYAYEQCTQYLLSEGLFRAEITGAPLNKPDAQSALVKVTTPTGTTVVVLGPKSAMKNDQDRQAVYDNYIGFLRTRDFKDATMPERMKQFSGVIDTVRRDAPNKDACTTLQTRPANRIQLDSLLPYSATHKTPDPAQAPGTPASRDAKREQDLAIMLYGIGQNLADHKGVFMCPEGPREFPKTDTLIAKAIYDIAPCLVPTYLPKLPTDPVTGSWENQYRYNTGYRMMINPNNGKLSISAPAAETGNKFIYREL